MAVSATGALAQQAGQLTLRDTHGAWEVRCAADNPGVCLMVQDGKNSAGETVIKIGLQAPKGATGPNGQPIAAVMSIEAPMGIALMPGVQLKIDGKEVGRAPYRFCAGSACVVNQPIDTALVDQLKRGSNAVVTITGLNGKTADANVSLSGFTKAFGSL